jgi:hypothetical protein
VGYVAFDEGMVHAFIDARNRFLRHGAKIIPKGLRLVGGPVAMEAEHARVVRFWSRDLHGFDYSGVGGYATEQRHIVSLGLDHLVSQPLPLLEVDLESVADRFAKGRAQFRLESECIVHGLATWAELELTPGDWLSFAPGKAPSWNHIMFPLGEPLPMEAGGTIEAEISTWNGRVWRWQLTAKRPDGGVLHRADHSTFAGFPMHAEDLHARASDAGQKLSPLGRAALVAIESLEAGLTAEDIAVLLAKRFPETLPTVGAARKLVDEVVQGFGPTVTP